MSPEHLSTTVSSVRIVLDLGRTVSDGNDNTVHTDLPPMKFNVDGRWTEDTIVCEGEGECCTSPRSAVDATDRDLEYVLDTFGGGRSASRGPFLRLHWNDPRGSNDGPLRDFQPDV